MKNGLLVVAVASLAAGLWFAWAHFQGGLSRDNMLALFGVSSLVWFVCATAWAYMRPGPG